MLLLNDYVQISSIRIFPQRNEEIEGVGTGQILRSELTEPLWAVDIVAPVSQFANGRKVRAILNDINRPNSHFRIADPISRYAANDPTGTLLTSVTIDDRVGNQVSFAGQPSGFVWTPGDSFHVAINGRHYYFEISQEGTGLVRTTPTVPQYIPLGTECVFISPQLRVQMIPSELELGIADSSTWAFGQFRIRGIQKL